jgi:hypothetical protein
MLQASIQNVSSVSDVCCKCVYLDDVVVIHICCKHMFINVSSVSNVYCKSASCCNISRRRKQTHAEVVPTGLTIPTLAASEVGVGGPHLHAHHRACGAKLHAYVHSAFHLNPLNFCGTKLVV